MIHENYYVFLSNEKIIEITLPIILLTGLYVLTIKSSTGRPSSLARNFNTSDKGFKVKIRILHPLRTFLNII